MEHTYWRKQASDKPLFPELLWSRPENKRAAGKLMIIGGHAQSFAAVAESYNEAVKAGIGTARVLLPDSLQKTVGAIFPEAEFAPSTPSGSFSQKALADMLGTANWADGVLFAGDLGRNSETAIALERFVEKYSGPVTITKDAADYFTSNPSPVIDRQDTTLVISYAQLQKMATKAHFGAAFTFDLPLLRLVEMLHGFTQGHSASIATKHLETMFVGTGGQVSSTKLDKDREVWRVVAAARAAVWQLQNPSKIFEALTTSIIDL